MSSEDWRGRIPTREIPTFEDKQRKWLAWLLPPTNLRDIPLWIIPRIVFPAMAFSIAIPIAHIAGDSAGVWVMLALALPGIIFIFITQKLAKSDSVLTAINFALIGFGVAILLGYLT